jgi:hypothetical protein
VALDRVVQLGGVRSRGHDVEPVLTQQRGEPVADEHRIVGDHDPHRPSRALPPADGHDDVRATQAAQRRLACVVEPHVAVGIVEVRELARERRGEDLAPARQLRDPRRLDQRAPAELAVAPLELTRVEADADAQRRLRRALQRDGAVQAGACTAEGEQVPRACPAVGRPHAVEQRVVARRLGAVGLREGHGQGLHARIVAHGASVRDIRNSVQRH